MGSLPAGDEGIIDLARLTKMTANIVSLAVAKGLPLEESVRKAEKHQKQMTLMGVFAFVGGVMTAIAGQSAGALAGYFMTGFLALVTGIATYLFFHHHDKLRKMATDIYQTAMTQQKK